MDPETKELIKEDLRLSQENNAMLGKLVWHQQVSRWFGIIKWVIIVGSTVGVLYYLEPLIGDLWATYQDLLGTVSGISVSSLPNR
jgi:hypothetical protein